MTALGAFFASYYRLRPVNATFTGIHDHDGRLPDWSPEGLESAVAEMREVRSALVADRARAAEPEPEGQPIDLADVDVRDRELAIAFLDIQIAEHEGAQFQRGNPSLALAEVAFGLIGLMTSRFAGADVRAAWAVERLKAAPTFLDGVCRSIAGPVPDEWIARSLRECDGLEVLLTTGVRAWPTVDRVSPEMAGRLADAAEGARAAVGRFRDWLKRGRESCPFRKTAPDPVFDLLLRRGHWYEGSAAALAAEASDALDAALARLNERALALAAGGWPEIQERLAATHPAPDNYLSAYQRTWETCRQQAIDARLVTWPDAPIRYVPIPAHMRDAAPFLYYLHYRSPAPFDRIPVHEYQVTPVDAGLDPEERRRRMRAANDSVIKLNHVIHHGGLGHHVQNYYAYRGASAIGRVAAVDCASRIGMFQGGTMAEGWACYATDLMEEHGFLTPDESVAQQHTRARLLARAVADIGLHRGSLSFENAVALYRDRVGMSDAAARAETCRNSMFPGAAVMYWLGTDALHRLRRDRERREGPAFSLQRFHDRVLSFGSIPVPLIAKVWA
jgi:uncharacterized protein (DUF885 family)